MQILTRAQGMLGKLRSRVRGDRFTADAEKPARVVPTPVPDAAPAAAAPPPAKEG
jgi:hypothetical protein